MTLITGRGRYRRETIPEEPTIGKKIGSALDKTEKIAKTTVNIAQTLDKTKETTLTRSGLLSSKDFTVIDNRYQPDGVNPINTKTIGSSIDIFERKPMPSSGDSIFHDIYDYGKNAFTGKVYDRIQINKNALENFEILAKEQGNPGGGVQLIGDLLKDKGFKEEQIRTILGDLESNYTFSIKEPVVPGVSFEPDISIGGNIGPTAHDPYPGITFPSVEPLSPEKSSNKALTSLNDLIKTKLGGLKESFKDTGFFPSAEKLEGAYPGKSTIPGKFDMPSLDKIVNVVPEGVGNFMQEPLDKVLQLGGKAEGVMGKIGQVGGLIKGVKGVAKLGDDTYQGVEDIIQGGIAFASPALIAAGPVGWAVLGLSAIEDMFLEDIIDFDW